jgi:hypothetical protein
MSEYHVAECMIRQLHARYTDAVWRKDIAAFADCFADDCEWRIMGRVMTGRAQASEFMNGIFARLERILITIRTPVLDIGDGIASGRSYFTELSVGPDGSHLAPIGSYYERFVDQGDRWRFSWRLFQLEYFEISQHGGTVFNNPDWGAPPAMPPRDTFAPDHAGFMTKQ